MDDPRGYRPDAPPAKADLLAQNNLKDKFTGKHPSVCPVAVIS